MLITNVESETNGRKVKKLDGVLGEG